MKNLFKLCLFAISIYALYTGEYVGLIGIGIVFGDTASPSSISKYFDTVFTTSLPNCRKKLTDNIGADQAILDRLMAGEGYESYDGGTDIEEPLLYALPSLDWYDGYDELPDSPTEGVTNAVFVAKQAAIPVSYSMKEIIQNKRKILSLVETKIKQTNMGASEGFARALVDGAGDGATRTSVTGTTGASGINSLHNIIDSTPTTTRDVGNIPQQTYSWWRPRTKDSQATTYTDLLLEANNLFDTCSLGTGGSPKLFLVDQITYEAINAALFIKYRQTSSDPQFRFNNTRLPFGNGQCLMVMDEKMIDAYTDLVPAVAGGAGALTYGTGFYVNTEFLKLRYIPERDFEMLTDENGKTFAKPLKGDSRLGHVGWMGELTVNNRRKQGVLRKIARSFTNT